MIVTKTKESGSCLECIVYELLQHRRSNIYRSMEPPAARQIAPKAEAGCRVEPKWFLYLWVLPAYLVIIYVMPHKLEVARQYSHPMMQILGIRGAKFPPAVVIFHTMGTFAKFTRRCISPS